MAAAEKLWMPRKVDNHDRKSAYRNDSQRQEWRGGLGYICYNKCCQAWGRTDPTHFSIFLSAMLKDAFIDMGDGVYIKSHHNTDLFTVAHFRAKTNTTNIVVRELLFIDDSVLITHSAEEIQIIVDAFAIASSKFDLRIHIKKTEVMFKPNSTTAREEGVNIDDTTPNPVQELKYNGSIIGRDGHIEAELQKRMSKAIMYIGRLRERLWNNHKMSMRAKRKVYRAFILSILLYGSETWTSVQQSREEATHFHDETSVVNPEDQMAGQSF